MTHETPGCKRQPYRRLSGLLVLPVALSAMLVSGVASGASATTVAAGNGHTCAVTSGGAVWCWGANWGGQLGDGTNTPRLTPVAVSPRLPALDVTAVTAGDGHTCAVTRAGAVWCWGDNRAGQLGDGTTTSRHTPVAVSGLTSGVVAITAGDYHTCAVASAGALWCWGSNGNGQLGDGTTTNRLTPVVVSGIEGATAIAAAPSHTCAVASGGAVWCWGWNGSGQLGDGTTTDALAPVAVKYLGSGVATVTAGGAHTCAVTSAGAVWCWGSGTAGQLGDGNRTNALTPVSVSGLLSGAVAVTAGGSHTCALTSAGAVWCWGENEGKTGDGWTLWRLTPVAVSGLGSGVVAIDAGGSHTCAVTSAGAVSCWGGNGSGQLGDGTSTSQNTPVPVNGLASGVAAVAPGNWHTCAVTDAGAVLCWGWNEYGQVGDGTTTWRVTPVAVSGLGSGVTAVSASQGHTCALTSGGAAWCWGRNWVGELGDDTTTSRSTPVAVTGLGSGVRAVAASRWHTCALTNAGAVLCWGDNSLGELGDGTTTNRHTPVVVNGLESGVVGIAAGSGHTCALTNAGAVLCWGGNNLGQLGDGTTTDRPTPGAVTGLGSGVAAVAATGGGHTCALKGGVAWCWGWNDWGQLGDGTTTNALTPVAVSGLGSSVAAISAGWRHSCARTSAGAAWCWGMPWDGRLGDGGIAWPTTLVPVVGLGSGVATIAAGESQTCAVTNWGAPRCWGINISSLPGDDRPLIRLTPVLVSGFAGAVPTVSSVAPIAGPTVGGTAVTITGTGFGAGATVTIGGVAATNVVVVSATSITATTPAGGAGPADVSVTTPGGTATLMGGFTYLAAPTVTGISPSAGSTLGGTPVTITGTGFVSGATVTLGGGAATSVTVVSATTVTAVTPAHAAGVVNLVVTNPDTQTGTLALAFTYVAVPAPDADADGLPDSWETGFGLNPNSAAGDNGAAGDPDHDGRTNLQEYQAGTHPRGFYTRYFAEGAIIPGFFEVDLALLNVDPLVDAHVWLRFLREGATEVGHAVAVPALGRRTVRVNDNPVMGTPAYTAFSTVVESDVPVVADRTMVWDDRGYGAHAETSIASPAVTWYLAEGATHSGFELYYLIQNPNPTAVTVQVTYLRPSPLAPVVQPYVVAASSRKTIYVNGEGSELAATDVSAIIESLDPRLPIIVERAMYLTDGWGHQFGAGHESAGVTTPSTHWFLAEGATVSAFGSTGSFFDMYILIANPNAGAATVTMTYLLPDGTTVTKTLGVAGNSRQTVYVNGADARLADTPVSTVVAATQPVIVERAMWWPGPTWATWYEAHNSPGTTETGTLWALAEGESGGDRGVETYILMANTSAYAGQVKVTLLFEDGTPATSEATFTLLANSRRTIYPPLDFAAAVPAGADRRYGVLVESVGTTPAQIVVERAMYANDDAGVVWAAGTNAVATRLK
jgi:alpha-tubulin suppressor-like RCC1 family protein